MNRFHFAALAATMILVAVLVSLASTALSAISLDLPAANANAAPRTEYMPCGAEDDNNCIWDAKHMGNGEGHSYFARPDGTVLYLDHHIAHALLHP
jgi:hypothetical protein